MRVCPHCAKPLQPVRYGVTCGPLAAHIIDVIEQAGPHGIRADDLFTRVYGNRPGATIRRLKSYIGAINAQLASQGVAIRIDRYSDHISVRRRTS